MEVLKVTQLEQQTLVRECRASGMKAKTWCEAKGIDYRRYLNWATRVNKEGQHKTQQWADVTKAIEVEERATDEISLKCGKWTILVATGFSPGLLADVLKVVDAIC